MTRSLLFVVALLAACNPEDPCAKYDSVICAEHEECLVFNAIELEPQGTGWCIPPDAVSAAVECMTAPPADCEAGSTYAAPMDGDGNATDTCYSYTGCEPPQGWADCATQPSLQLAVCD